MKEKQCSFVPYGDEENRCTKCGYITWVDTSKTHEEILEDMVKVGYDKPSCRGKKNEKQTFKLNKNGTIRTTSNFRNRSVETKDVKNRRTD